MMFKKSFAWLAVFTLGGILVFFSAPESRAAGESLKDLRKSFFNRKEQLLYDYLEQLVKLETLIVTSRDPQEARDVKAEIGRVEQELQGIPDSPPEAAHAPPAPRQPAPKPVVVKREPKSHVSRIEGLAGAPSFSKNNIYTFHLADIGRVSTLKFWATGRRSIDSVGYVWLITPDGRREKISKWKERYFDKPATELTSPEEIEPFSEDISELVTKAGNYQIEFEWTGGIDPLVIFRVELIS